MTTVTIPGTGSTTIGLAASYNNGANAALANSIATLLNNAQSLGTLEVQTIAGGGNAPAPDTVHSVHELLIEGGGNYTNLAGWVVIDATSQAVTLQGSATTTVLGGGSLITINDPGEVVVGDVNASTAGANNVINLSSLDGGAQAVGNNGNDTITAAGVNQTITGGSGENVLSMTGATGTILGGTGFSSIFASGTGDIVGLTSGFAAVTFSGTDETLFAGTSGVFTGVATGGSTGAQFGLTASGAVTLAGTQGVVFGGSGGTSVLDTGTADSVGGGSGALAVTSSGSGAGVFAGAGGLTAVLSGDNDIIFGGPGDIAATLSGTGDQVGAGTGTTNLLITGNNATVLGNTGLLSVNQAAGGGLHLGLNVGVAAAVTLGGTGGDQVFANQGFINLVASGTGSDTIGLGTGVAQISAGGSTNLQVNEIAGGGALTFIGGAGSSTIFGAAASHTLFGGAGGVITYGAPTSAGTMNYQAGGGSETINSVFSLSNDSLSGGTVAGSTVSMVGGAGNDTFSAGAGTDTMVGAGGNNLFLFTKAVLTAAPSDVVSQFTSNDQVLLAGYGAGEAQHALSTATSAFNNTTLTLSDNTKITFLGTSLQQLIGHVSSN